MTQFSAICIYTHTHTYRKCQTTIVIARIINILLKSCEECERKKKKIDKKQQKQVWTRKRNKQNWVRKWLVVEIGCNAISVCTAYSHYDFMTYKRHTLFNWFWTHFVLIFCFRSDFMRDYNVNFFVCFAHKQYEYGGHIRCPSFLYDLTNGKHFNKFFFFHFIRLGV